MTENPLSKEQIEELNEIAKFPQEKQRERLNEFLQTLTPEQIEFLKSNQGSACVFCGIIEGKIPAKKIYEDDYVMAVLDINPANRGHVVLFPKIHYEIMSLMKDVGYLFNVANKISSAVFEATNAEGTNIFVANGLAAGQKAPHVVVHIIPRFKDDKVKFLWDKTDVPEKQMDELVKSLKSKLGKHFAVIEEKKEIEKVTDRNFSSRRIP